MNVNTSHESQFIIPQNAIAQKNKNRYFARATFVGCIFLSWRYFQPQSVISAVGTILAGTLGAVCILTTHRLTTSYSRRFMNNYFYRQLPSKNLSGLNNKTALSNAYERFKALPILADFSELIPLDKTKASDFLCKGGTCFGESCVILEKLLQNPQIATKDLFSSSYDEEAYFKQILSFFKSYLESEDKQNQQNLTFAMALSGIAENDSLEIIQQKITVAGGDGLLKKAARTKQQLTNIDQLILPNIDISALKESPYFHMLSSPEIYQKIVESLINNPVIKVIGQVHIKPVKLDVKKQNGLLLSISHIFTFQCDEILGIYRFYDPIDTVSGFYEFSDKATFFEQLSTHISLSSGADTLAQFRLHITS